MRSRARGVLVVGVGPSPSGAPFLPIAEQPRTRYATSISMISAGSGFSPNRSEPGSCRNFRPKRERRTVFFLSGASPKPSLK
jgi:hypothetical protein